MNDIRIGLIGCGGIAQKHMNEYLGAHGGHVYAVCDIDEARRRAAGEKCGVPAERQFADWRELLACRGHLHAEQSARADGARRRGRGKAVLRREAARHLL